MENILQVLANAKKVVAQTTATLEKIESEKMKRSDVEKAISLINSLKELQEEIYAKEKVIFPTLLALAEAAEVGTVCITEYYKDIRYDISSKRITKIDKCHDGSENRRDTEAEYCSSYSLGDAFYKIANQLLFYIKRFIENKSEKTKQQSERLNEVARELKRFSKKKP